jgi:hypothetical protein
MNFHVLPVSGVPAAIDVQGLAGHEPGRLQVEDRLDHLPDLAHPPQRVQPGEEGVRLGPVWGWMMTSSSLIDLTDPTPAAIIVTLWNTPI